MNSDQADQLHRKLITASEADEVLRELENLDKITGTGDVDAQSALGLRHAALRALHRILGSDATASREIIIQRLLPLCVQDAETEELERNVVFINCRELAGEWLNALVGPTAIATSEEALGFLLAQIEVKQCCLPACWTISEIGYRTADLTSRLWALAESSDQDEGDTALATLAVLGLSGEERSRCVTAALAVARERLPYTIVNALTALPDPETISVLSEAWLERPQTEIEAEATTLFSLFAQLGAGVSEPAAIDGACVAIRRLLTRTSGTLGRLVRLSGQALPRIDSPHATELLVGLLAEQTASSFYDRWLVMLRLAACCRPRQLEGLEAAISRDRIVHDRTVIAALSECALNRGEDLGRNSTFEGDVKVAALETALLLGVEEMTTWLGPTLANEGNPYLQKEIMEVFAALRIFPLPAEIARWIVEEKHLGREAEDNVELMRRLAASRVARSAATPEAFDLLSRPGLLREDAVMLETAQGLVAATLFVGEDPEQRSKVLERLFLAVERPDTAAQLASTCHAIAAVARRGWLAEAGSQDRLLAALRSEPPIPLRPFNRAQLVAAVAALPAESLPAWLPEQLAAWAREKDALGERSVQALIELKLFPRFSELLAAKLGLHRMPDDRWQWSLAASEQLEWGPLGVVLLYAQDPEAFAPALCAVFDDERWFVRHDTVGLLKQLAGDRHVPLLEAVCAALMARVRRRQSSRFADPPLLRQVAALMPERFAAEPWSEHYGDWLEDARAALADALGALPKEIFLASVALHQSVAGQLVTLARDGQFSVRRAAHRSLGRVQASALETFCDSLARSPEAGQRTLVAEAWAWLPEAAVERSEASAAPVFRLPDIEAWSRRFTGDPSKHVRETARNAAAARRRRSWAETYLLQLMTLTNPSNSELLRSWKLGLALTQAGDDETLRRLTHHLEVAALAPSLRFRLNRVAKDLEKKWNAVTKKWPEPSLALPGGVETFDARLRSREHEWPVRCTLWHVAGVAADLPRRWGGIAVVENPGHPLEFLTAFADTEAQLFIGETSTQIAIHSTENNGLIVFTGAGTYPVAG